MRNFYRLIVILLITSSIGIALDQVFSKILSWDTDFINGLNRLMAQEGLDWRITEADYDVAIELMEATTQDVLANFLTRDPTLNVSQPFAITTNLTISGSAILQVEYDWAQAPGSRVSFSRITPEDRNLRISSQEFLSVFSELGPNVTYTLSYRANLGREFTYQRDLDSDNMTCRLSRYLHVYPNGQISTRDLTPRYELFNYSVGRNLPDGGVDFITGDRIIVYPYTDNSFEVYVINQDGTSRRIGSSDGGLISQQSIQEIQYCMALFENDETNGEINLPPPR